MRVCFLKVNKNEKIEKHDKKRIEGSNRLLA